MHALESVFRNNPRLIQSTPHLAIFQHGADGDRDTASTLLKQKAADTEAPT